MTALADNLGPVEWYDSLSVVRKRPRAGTVATAVRIFLGALVMAVDGVARPVLNGTDQITASIPLLVAGADANGGMYFTARIPGVRVVYVSGAAEIVSITYGATIDVTITYNNGTSTQATMAKFLQNNGEVMRLLRFKIQGTGASSPAAVTATAVPCVQIEGVSRYDLNNSAGGSPMAIDPSIAFEIGAVGLVPKASDVPLDDSLAYLEDDQTVRKTADGLSLRGRVVASRADASLSYLDLATVE